MSYTKKILPLIVIQLYLSLVLCAFTFGPWPWPISNDNPVFFYLIVCQLVMISGYLSSKYLKPKIIPKKKFQYRKNQIFIIFILSLLVSFLTLYGRTGSVNLNIFTDFSDVGENYKSTLEGRSVFVEYIRMVFSVSLFMFIPLGLYNFKNLSLKYKFLFGISLFVHVAVYIKMGTNKGLFDLISFLPWLYLIYQFKQQNKIYYKKLLIRGFYLVFLLSLALLFFTQSQLQRPGEVGKKAIQDMGVSFLEANQEKPDFVKEEYYLGYLAFTRYLTHGYYAFSQSFEIEYENTFPFGSSMFLSRKANSIFNTNYFSEKSFPGMLDKKTGWSYQMQWHSIYSWLVSDYGPLGILIILFILSRKLAKYWILSISNDNFMNLIKFLILTILFFYIPANNQIFQNAETTILFLTLFFFRPILSKISSYSK